MQLFGGSEWARQVFHRLQPDFQTPVDRFIFIARNLKRVDLFHQIRIRVDELFNIRRVHLRAEKRHGQIAATIHEEDWEAALLTCELENIYSSRRQLFSQLLEGEAATEIVQ